MANVRIVNNKDSSKAINKDIYETTIPKKPENNPNDMRNVISEYIQILGKQEEIEKNKKKEVNVNMKKMTKFKDKFNDDEVITSKQQKKKIKKKERIHEAPKKAEYKAPIIEEVNNENEELSPELEKFANIIVDGMMEKFVTRDEVRTLVEAIIQGMVMKNVGPISEKDTDKVTTKEL